MLFCVGEVVKKYTQEFIHTFSFSGNHVEHNEPAPTGSPSSTLSSWSSSVQTSAIAKVDVHLGSDEVQRVEGTLLKLRGASTRVT